MRSSTSIMLRVVSELGKEIRGSAILGAIQMDGTINAGVWTYGKTRLTTWKATRGDQTRHFNGHVKYFYEVDRVVGNFRLFYCDGSLNTCECANQTIMLIWI